MAKASRKGPGWGTAIYTAIIFALGWGVGNDGVAKTMAVTASVGAFVISGFAAIVLAVAEIIDALNL